jgi:hypothetical protein
MCRRLQTTLVQNHASGRVLYRKDQGKCTIQTQRKEETILYLALRTPFS